MATKDGSRTKGTVFDLVHAMSLSADDCNVLAVSTRTLYFLQAFGRAEIGFLVRYASQFLDGGAYIVADSDQDKDDINNIVNNYQLEVIDMSCSLVEALASLQAVIQGVSCGCPVGQGNDNEAGEEGGPVPSPVGDIVYQEPSLVQDRDCKASNLIHQTLLDIFVELDNLNVDDMSVLGLALAVGVVTGIFAAVVATPLAGVVVGVAGMVAIFTAQLIGITVSLGDIANAMTVRQEDLVCSLWDSVNVDDARDGYLAVLNSQGLGTAELALVEILMTNTLMNIRFFDTGPTALFWPAYVGPVDCAVCVSQEEDWMLLPNGFVGASTASGTLGIGTVLNDGTEFEIVAEERTGFPGQYLIGLVINIFWSSQTNKETLEDDPCVVTNVPGIEFVSHTGTAFQQTRGRQCVVCLGAVGDTAPSFVPAVMPTNVMVFYLALGPFTMTFKTVGTATVCF